MNILPKKSWHVRKKENIEKVRKDEKEARDQEVEEERRRAMAEREARTGFLRRRARDAAAAAAVDASNSVGSVGERSSISSGKQVALRPEEPPEHFNLFTTADARMENADNRAEKKAETEKAERKLGVLTYLGESSVELRGKNGDKPWYFSLPEQHRLRSGGNDASAAAAASAGKDLKRKERLDPLNELNEFVKRSKKDRGDEKKKKKHKKKKEKKEKTKRKSIEELRAERLEREKRAKVRRNNLLNPQQAAVAEPVADERERGYNNQFNPHLTRKPRHDSRR